jgi:trk system potassium uptake protein TrkA
MEFVVRPGTTNITGIKLSELGLKKNLLVCAINRGGKIITPTGQDTIEDGDIVVIVTTRTGIRDLNDIVRY